MITFKTLTMRNFMSFGNAVTTINFDTAGTTFILGENLDDTDSGTGTNGVGKTTLLNALVYAIYDKPVSNISKDNLVNNVNRKNMIVTIEFDIKKDTYMIKRARKTKAGAAGNYVHLFKNGKDITPDSVSNTNEKIERIIGIPYELFVRIVAFSATLVPFLDLPLRSHYTANQTDIIEELFEYKTLSEKANILKEEIKITEQALKEAMIAKNALEKEHERHLRQIEAAEKREYDWVKNNRTEIADIRIKLKKIEDVDIDHQHKIHQELTTIKTSIISTKREIKHLTNELESARSKFTKANDELVHLRDAKCPYCLQKYDDTELKIKSTEDLATTLSLLAATKQKELDILNDSFNELIEKEHTLSNEIVVNDPSELLAIRQKKGYYEQHLVDLEHMTNPFTEPLKELEAIQLDPVVMTEVNELESTVNHQKFLLKLLTKKDSFVRKTLLNKNIPFLNKQLAKYLDDLGLPHTVEFTHEMTASISQFGRPLDFGNLSNGQRARVNLALSFAFRDVLQKRIQGKINVCILDEVLDVGLDAMGVQNAARMLKKKARDEKLSINIISHRDEIGSAFDRKMIVQYSRGFSFIKIEEST